MQGLSNTAISKATKFRHYQDLLELQLNDFDEFCIYQKEYQEAINRMPSPPFDWDESKASLDGFCEITTSNIVKSSISEKPFIIASIDEIKCHFLKNLCWQKPLICAGPINVLPFVFRELSLKLVIRNNDKLHERVSKHFVNSSLKKITAHHLAGALEKGLGSSAEKVFEEIMKHTLKKPTIAI